MNSRPVTRCVLARCVAAHCVVAVWLTLSACSDSRTSTPPPELSPEVFAAFFPSGEENSFEASVRPAEIRAPAAVDTEDGWKRVTRADQGGFIDARYVGTTSDSLLVYQVRSNDGGTTTRAAIVIVEIARSQVNRRGLYWTENIRDNSVTLEGDTLRYGMLTIPVEEVLDPRAP